MLDEPLLDTIYASVFDDEAMLQALAGMARACRSRCAGVFRLSPGGIDHDLAHGLPEGFMQDFARHAVDDPRVAWSLARGPMTLMDDSADHLRRRMCANHTDALTREWDLPWTLATLCATEGDAAWSVYLTRSRRQGPADDDARAGFARLAPHFRRALQLRIEAQRHLRQARTGGHGAPRCSGHVVIDGAARVLMADAEARAMLRGCHGISDHEGRLALSTPTRSAKLRRLAALLVQAPQLAPLSGRLDLPQTRPPAMLSMHIDAAPGRRIHGRRVLDVWLDYAAPQAAPEHATGQPTPRQMQVLQLLDAGVATADMARQLGIAVATVRTHVKRLLALTETHNRPACLAEGRRRGWI